MAGKAPGSFRERKNGTIEHRQSFGYDAEGRRIQLSVYGKTKRECVEKMGLKFEEIRRAGGIPIADDTTVGAWLDAWLMRRRASRDQGEIAPKTFDIYESTVRLHVKPYIGGIRLAKLSIRDGETWQAALEKAGAGGRTRQYARTVLVSALNDAMRSELIDRNPIALLRAPRHRRAEITPWSAAEALQFLEAAKSDRFYALWVLALTTGPRPHELLGLRPGDVADGRLTITQQLSKGKQERRATKTSTSRRTIGLTTLAIDALKAHRAMILGEGLRASPWLFPTMSGTAMSYRNLIMRHWNVLLKRSGVRKVRPYDLRHTYATLALTAGVPLHVVSRSLGHASAAFTASTYAHLSESLEAAHLVQIEAIFSAAV